MDRLLGRRGHPVCCPHCCYFPQLCLMLSYSAPGLVCCWTKSASVDPVTAMRCRCYRSSLYGLYSISVQPPPSPYRKMYVSLPTMPALRIAARRPRPNPRIQIPIIRPFRRRLRRRRRLVEVVGIRQRDGRESVCCCHVQENRTQALLEECWISLFTSSSKSHILGYPNTPSRGPALVCDCVADDPPILTIDNFGSARTLQMQSPDLVSFQSTNTHQNSR